MSYQFDHGRPTLRIGRPKLRSGPSMRESKTPKIVGRPMEDGEPPEADRKCRKLFHL